MKYTKYGILFICSFLLLIFSGSAFSIEVAPRISDREIVEKLVSLEAGQGTLRSEMKIGDDSLRSEMKAGYDALGQRIADLRSEMKSGNADLRSEMKSGNAALRSEMKAGDEALRSEMKAGQDALGKRMDDMNATLNTLFIAVVTLIVALFAFIAWDRRTMLKPVVDRLERLDRSENDIIRDLEINHKDGSLLNRLVNVLRELAKHDEKVASVLRSFSLL